MSESGMMTRRGFLRGLAAGAAGLALLGTLPGCDGGEQGVAGTWYGVNTDGQLSTLELNEDGTWLFNGPYTANGDWDETDSGAIVLSAPLMSVPFTLEGSGDDRTLVFAGEDPSYGNAPAISKSTFYATEAARDAAAGE